MALSAPKKSSELNLQQWRKTYKQALRGLFVAGTSTDSHLVMVSLSNYGKGRMMNQD